jgi:beta-glucosidase
MPKIITLITIAIVLAASRSSAQYYQTNTPQEKSGFQWPEGKKMGLSFTFDDARLSQIDKGMPLLDKFGVKATFYILPDKMVLRREAWEKAVKSGHDIGNHSLHHPCTGNFDWSGQHALEDYTLPCMNMELDSANKTINKLLGIEPVSFAYPCGQTFIGKGLHLKSYIPLVAAMFETGREWRSENPNNPAYCDMSQLASLELDGKTFDEIVPFIESAKTKGQWLILAGHEMNEGGSQTSLLSTIEAICKYASDPTNGIWIDHVHHIASYIKNQRGESSSVPLPDYQNPLFSIQQRVEDLLARMTLEEKLGQLNVPCPLVMAKDSVSRIDMCKRFAEGILVTNIGPAGGFFAATNIFKQGPRRHAEFLNELQKIAFEKTRLKIPLLFVEEGTHGLVSPGATIFPEGLAIGSTWNTDMVKNIYAVAAREARARGVHELGTLVIEPNRDPRLGRNEEGYSEDPYLCSQIAEAVVTGMQGNDISADNKAISLLCHFPGQSQPVSGLERGAMEISERTLREVFLPPWIAGIKKAGALGVMATYPSIDGEPVHASKKLLTKILREELEFKGLVLCEGEGMKILVYEKIVPTMKQAGELCLKAGVDVSIWHEDGYLNAMRENVQEGKVSMETIDRSVRRILKIKFLLGLFDNPYVDVGRAVAESITKTSRELALQVAREGIVLLKNENNLLPLGKNIKSIAVIGPNANSKRNQLGDYVAGTIIQDVVTVLEGIRNRVSPQTKVSYFKGCEIIGNELDEIAKAKEAAKKAEIAIVVVGEAGNKTNGESHDVASLDLTGYQEELIKAVQATGTPTIAVLINGRPLSIRWTAAHIPVILEAWMCGEEGGNAVADVLFGDYNPSGRLPITVPRHSGQLPVYYNYRPSKEYWIKHGYGKAYEDISALPLFEFGFGLSYTSFEYSNLLITPNEIGPAGEISVSVDVKNIGKRDGSEVVQLYIDDVISSLSTPVKELKGFEKLQLAVGEKKSVHFKLLPEHLSFLDRNLEPIVEPGTFVVMVGSSSEDIRLKGEFEVKR